MAATAQNERQDALVGGSPFDLGAAQTGKAKSRVPEILVGTFLVALFALAGAWFYSTSTSSVAYVALREPVQRGEVVEESQLIFYELSSDTRFTGIRSADYTSVVGKVALVDMPAGMLITQDQFAESSQIPRGFGIVGLELAPGEFPTFGLRPGDRVRVIITPRNGDFSQPGSITVIDDDVEVIEVNADGGRSRFISLTLPAELADLVAAADADERVRLIQVPGS